MRQKPARRTYWVEFATDGNASAAMRPSTDLTPHTPVEMIRATHRMIVP
jgi:hypothetical protein